MKSWWAVYDVRRCSSQTKEIWIINHPGLQPHFLSKAIWSTSGGRPDKYLSMEMLQKTDPRRRGSHLSPFSGNTTSPLLDLTDSVGSRLCPSHLLHNTYLLIKPCFTFFLFTLLLLRTHGCHIFLQRKRSQTASRVHFNCSHGPGLLFKYASEYPNTKEALGVWFPFCSSLYQTN